MIVPRKPFPSTYSAIRESTPPRPDSVPAPTGKPPKHGREPAPRSQDWKSWAAIATAISSVLVVALKPPPPSPTGAETVALRAALEDARAANAGFQAELERADVSALREEARALREQIQTFQSTLDGLKAADTRLAANQTLLAEGFSRLNQGAPVEGFPEPDPRRWFVPLSPPPLNRTDRRWER